MALTPSPIGGLWKATIQRRQSVCLGDSLGLGNPFLWDLSVWRFSAMLGAS